MKLSICDKNKKDLFIALFQTLKNCSNVICIIFKNDHIHIQGMDKSHVCLYEVKIVKQWFHTYDLSSQDSDNICVDSHTFHTIISKVHDSQSIIVYFNGKTDILNIDLTGETSTTNSNSNSTSVNKDYNKYFKIPLVEFENDIMDVPSADYEAEFTIIAKKICEITNQMLLFGTDIHFKCSEEQIDLVTNGVTGEMLVKIPIEDLNEYSVIEDEVVDIKYSLAYVDKMCLTNKLSNEIQFCISRDFPMKIKYDLGDDSSVVFYIAPMVHE
jgi:hypothetical protein